MSGRSVQCPIRRNLVPGLQRLGTKNHDQDRWYWFTWMSNGEAICNPFWNWCLLLAWGGRLPYIVHVPDNGECRPCRKYSNRQQPAHLLHCISSLCSCVRSAYQAVSRCTACGCPRTTRRSCLRPWTSTSPGTHQRTSDTARQWVWQAAGGYVL